MKTGRKLDLKGQKFGRLLVIEEAGKAKDGRIRWECKCDCGSYTSTPSTKTLRNGNCQSCGCLQKEKVSESNKTHGLRNTRIYSIHAGMKKRCNNPNAHRYERYGGRGIKVCEEWNEKFEAFYDWAMANGYEEDLEIDRIDNDGDYEPGNCRWVTSEKNNNNRRSNVRIKIGEEEHTIAEWERIYGLKRYRLNRAIDRGADPEEYLSQFKRRCKDD